MVSGNNGDVFVVFNLFTKVDFLVVIGSKALSIFEDQFIPCFTIIIVLITIGITLNFRR